LNQTLLPWTLALLLPGIWVPSSVLVHVFETAELSLALNFQPISLVSTCPAQLSLRQKDAPS
jgi:hypothetical protein